MSPGYDFWLVDLDGTLVDVEPSYIQHVLSRVGERIGYRFTSRQAEQLWHGLNGSPNDQLEHLGIDPRQFWDAFHEVEDAQARSDATFLYRDASEIGRLNCPVGLVTHCQSYLTTPVLERLGIAEWFDTIVCCDDRTGWKPDPRPVEYAMESLGATQSADSGVLVGDSPTDIGAAWNAGLDGVHVDRHGPERRGCCIRADTRVTSFEELL